MSVRDSDAIQLRAIAPLVVATTKQLVGPAMLVTNGHRTIAITGSELLRPWEAGTLAIATLDGSQLVPVASWGLGRYSGVGLVELDGPVGGDIAPLTVGAVCATVDTRGAPSALVTVVAKGTGFAREVVPVHVDNIDTSGGMSDDALARLASPIEPRHVGLAIAGAILFSWFPADPVLGRKSEVLAVAIAYPYTLHVWKPRDLPAMAELLGLDDLGRALVAASAPEARPELSEVTGEISDESS